MIHVDIEDETGKTNCFEKEGGFFSAVGALFAIWRYGKGRIEIGDVKPEETPALQKERNKERKIEEMVS